MRQSVGGSGIERQLRGVFMGNAVFSVDNPRERRPRVLPAFVFSALEPRVQENLNEPEILTHDLQHLRNLATQIGHLVSEFESVFPLARNAIMNQPGETMVKRAKVEHLSSIKNFLRDVREDFLVNKEAWISSWTAYFESMTTANPEKLKMGTCSSGCLEDKLTIVVCSAGVNSPRFEGSTENNGSEHSMCVECFLTYYWEESQQCTRSGIKCPLCRQDLNICQVFE